MISKEQVEDSKSLLYGLPQEIILELITWLVGDFNFLNDHVDIPSRTKVLSEEYMINAYKPPFENIKTLIRLTITCKKFHGLIRGQDDQGFERFWLRGFVFFQKVLYWIRTSSLENLNMGQGDYSPEELDEIIRIESLIAAFERGKASPILDLNSLMSTLDEPLDMSAYSDRDNCENLIRSRLDHFNITFEDYEKEYKHSGSAFELFLTQSIILSLDMYKRMDTENASEYWYSGFDVLIASDYVERWPLLQKPKGKNLGVRIDQQKGWNYFVGKKDEYPVIQNVKPFLTNQINQIKQTSQISNSWRYGAGLAICVLSYWSLYFALASPLLFVPKRWFEQKPSIAVSEIKNEVELENSNEDECIDYSELKERLSGFIFLNLFNVLYFDPVKDFIFPESIRFLSVEFSDHSAYCKFPENRWNSFFSGCSFPGVRLLRVRIDENFSPTPRMSIDQFSRILFQSLLTPKVLPNLNCLLLSGFNKSDCLIQQMDFLKQLHNIEIVFDRNDIYGGWYSLSSFTSSLSKQSKTLKSLIMETNADTRMYMDHVSLKSFYVNHQCAASVGSHSISKFYNSSYE